MPQLVIDDLRDTLGEELVSEPLDDSPVVVVRPKDLEGAATAVRLAREHHYQVVAIGGGTKRHWTDPPLGPAVELDMRGCTRVVDYSPDDMTITVEAGLSLPGLAAVLAKRGQRVTLDPPHGERATVGGVLAANDSGPIRLAYGTARDAVIGMSMIQADGQTIHSGGRVVKNVAGYDLHKLFIGSFGTLGPIATATFRLRPLPEARGVAVLYPRDAAHAEQLLSELLSGPTRPTFLELLNARMAKAINHAPRLTLAVGFEETADGVRWQCEQLRKGLSAEPLGDDEAQAMYERLREAAGAAVEASFKATMLSSQVADFIERLAKLPIRMIARAGNGVVYGLLEGPIHEAAWQDIEERAMAGGGMLHIRGAMPGPFARRFGRQRGDAHLSAAIQRAFDPDAIFAPQRLG